MSRFCEGANLSKLAKIGLEISHKDITIYSSIRLGHVEASYLEVHHISWIKERNSK